MSTCLVTGTCLLLLRAVLCFMDALCTAIAVKVVFPQCESLKCSGIQGAAEAACMRAA